MKKITKAIEYVIYTAIACIVLLLVASALPIPGGIQTYIVRSGSMEPAIKTGSVVVVRPQESYSIGEIITFAPNQPSDAPTTHRIVDIRLQDGRYLYTTKGDANEEVDRGEVRQRSILGTTLISIPYVGYAVVAAKTRIGFTALVVLPAVVIAYDQAMKIVREVQRSRTRKKKIQNARVILDKNT